MITINANVDRTSTTRTLKALEKFGVAEGLTVQFVAWDTMRLWARRCLLDSPPWAGGKKPSNTSAAFDSGKAAITFDLFGGKKNHRGILGVITPEIRSWMEWNGNMPNHVLIKLKSGAVYLIDKNLYGASAGQAEIREHHLKYRMKNGRVTTAGRRDRMIGRWKAVDKLFIQPGSAAAYLRNMHKKVGSLKAGWLPSIYHYAALCNGPGKKGIPQWITRHSGVGGYGGYMDKTGNGMIFSENTSHHASAIREKNVEKSRSIVEKGLRYGKNGIPYRLQRLINQWNKGQVPSPNLKAAS